MQRGHSNGAQQQHGKLIVMEGRSDPTDQAAGSLSNRIYLALRDQIISGHLVPGTRLRERELADEFGVSRIPIREALPRLEAEGFVSTLHHSGAVVTQLTLRDVEELFDVRLATEVLSCRLAAYQIAKGASPQILREAMARSEVAVHSGNLDDISDKSAELHETIIALADNALLSSMMRAVSGRDRWIFRMTQSRDPNIACAEHQELCAAIEAGNTEYAAAISYAHIERGRLPTLEILKDVLPPWDAKMARPGRVVQKHQATT